MAGRGHGGSRNVIPGKGRSKERKIAGSAGNVGAVIETGSK